MPRRDVRRRCASVDSVAFCFSLCLFLFFFCSPFFPLLLSSRSLPSPLYLAQHARPVRDGSSSSWLPHCFPPVLPAPGRAEERDKKKESHTQEIRVYGGTVSRTVVSRKNQILQPNPLPVVVVMLLRSPQRVGPVGRPRQRVRGRGALLRVPSLRPAPPLSRKHIRSHFFLLFIKPFFFLVSSRPKKEKSGRRAVICT